MTVTDYLKQNKEVISISALEKLLKIPSGTVAKAVKGEREMPFKHEQALHTHISNNLLGVNIFKPKQQIEGSDIITDITQYELVTQYNTTIRRQVPVKNTYAHKKTGEVVQIDYRKGAFRLI